MAILCNNCLRNIAFYRAGWAHGRLRVQEQFWINASGNFIDIAVLEWTKLFADKKGKHHWSKLPSVPASFLADLCGFLDISNHEFEAYIDEVRTYRDKFIAHLDDERIMHIPKLRPARKSVAYLYEYLLNTPQTKGYLPDMHLPAARCYAEMYRHAFAEYRARKGKSETILNL